MCYCFLRNLTDPLNDGFTAWQNRLADEQNESSAKPLKEFNGSLLRFGQAIEYKPSSPEDHERIHKFGSQTILGIWVGYDQATGGGWSGAYRIIDQEEVENGENASDIDVKRIKEVIVPNGVPSFPLAQGTLKQPCPGSRRSRKR